MTVYYIVWIITILLGIAIQNTDFYFENELTVQRRYHRSTAKFLYTVASLGLIFVAGCRYYVGADFGAYYNYWNYLDFWDSLKSLDEPGIRLIYSLAVRIHESRQFCIFAVAAVTLGLQLGVIYKNTDQIGFAVILFVFMCWTACFNGVRQALAVAVLFCGFPALRERDFKRYTVFAFLAFLCHRSAIVMIALFFFTSRKATGRNLFVLMLLSVAAMFMYDRLYDMVNIVLEHELTGNEAYWSTRVNRLRPLAGAAPAVFFLYLYRKIEKTEIVSFYLNILVISAVISVVTMNSAAMARISMYTAPFMVIALVELIKILPKKSRGLVTILMVALYGVFEWYNCNGVLFTAKDLRWIW